LLEAYATDRALRDLQNARKAEMGFPRYPASLRARARLGNGLHAETTSQGEAMRTQLCDLFGIDVPIFAFSHCRDVVAAVTNAGGMGVRGALAFSPEQLDLELKWIDEHVDGRPYGVDIVMPANYSGKDEGLGRADEATGAADSTVFKNMIPQEVTDWIEKILEEFDVAPLPEDYSAATGVGGSGSQGLLG
jgi:hypothetical protein